MADSSGVPEKFCVAVIGTGSIGMRHLRVLSQMTGVQPGLSQSDLKGSVTCRKRAIRLPTDWRRL